MSVFALASAKGSPGTTLTALALAAAWPGPTVLADLDPVGGDVIWRCRSAAGEPLDPNRGLLSLGAAVRRGTADVDLDEHLQTTATGQQVLVGIASPDQQAGLGGSWPHLASLFAGQPADVLVDCGRVVPGSPAMPVLSKADAVLFVVRPDIEGVAALRERLRSLRDPLGIGVAEGTPIGIAVVTSYRDTRVAADLQQLLDSERLGARVLGIVAHDPRTAQVLASVRPGRTHKSLLGRSANELAGRLLELARERHLVGGR